MVSCQRDLVSGGIMAVIFKLTIITMISTKLSIFQVNESHLKKTKTIRKYQLFCC